MTASLRVVFLGSPPFGAPVLKAVAESRHDLSLVVTRPDLPRGRGRSIERGAVAALGDEHGIDVLQPKTTRDASFVEALKARQPDVLLVASYGEILNEEVLAVPALAPLNVHASLLPRHRGSSPIQAAILQGDASTGVSVQRMVLALDAGDVLLEHSVLIKANETAGELHDRLALLAGVAAVDALDALSKGDAEFTPQDEAEVTITRRLRKGDGEMDLSSQSAADLVRHVRAMTPWPGAKSTLHKPGSEALPFALHEVLATERPGWDGSQAGDLLVEGDRLFLALKGPCVELIRVQPAGKRPMSASDFIRGARLEVGARLGGDSCPA